MSPEQNSPEDRALRECLREWKVRAELPPRFQASVWRRIESLEQRDARSSPFWGRLQAWLAQPALAGAYVTVLLAGGLVGGYWQAQNSNAQTDATLRARYVQSIDPYQMIQLDHHHGQ